MADVSLKNLYSCVICKQKFRPYLLYYSCADGHFFCKRCYRDENLNAQSSNCLYKLCKSKIFEIDNRTSKPYVKVFKKSLKMFPEPLSISKTSLKETTMRRNKNGVLEGRQSSCSINSLSKKPVNCPYGGCDKSIAVTAVGFHFKFEHNSVAFINSCFEARHSLRLHPCAINYKTNFCILLIKILEENKTDVRLPIEHNKETAAAPIMIVSGTRISNNECVQNLDISESDASTEDFDIYPAKGLDKILLWVSCNIPSQHKYTIAVSTACQTVRLKYFGTIAQITDNPEILLKQGKGLILNSSHVIGMTNYDKQPVNLDVIIHNEELFESD